MPNVFSNDKLFKLNTISKAVRSYLLNAVRDYHLHHIRWCHLWIQYIDSIKWLRLIVTSKQCTFSIFKHYKPAIKPELSKSSFVKYLTFFAGIQ